LLKSKGWCDFGISISAHKEFLKHYASHVEPGEESISDPFMGGML
jgi:phospholipase C